MKTYNITINNLTFEELKETVSKLGEAAIAGTVTEAPKAPTAASVMTASTPEVVKEAPKAAPKAAPAKRASTKKVAQEPAVPLFVPEENEEMESVPSPYAPSQPISSAQPTVEVVHSAHVVTAFDRQGTIDSINATVAALSNKLQNIEAVRAVINDTYVSLGMNAEPMTKLPDDKMAVVYKAFFNKAQGILNGSLAGALV